MSFTVPPCFFWMVKHSWSLISGRSWESGAHPCGLVELVAVLG